RARPVGLRARGVYLRVVEEPVGAAARGHGLARPVALHQEVRDALVVDLVPRALVDDLDAVVEARAEYVDVERHPVNAAVQLPAAGHPALDREEPGVGPARPHRAHVGVPPAVELHRQEILVRAGAEGIRVVPMAVEEGRQGYGGDRAAGGLVVAEYARAKWK